MWKHFKIMQQRNRKVYLPIHTEAIEQVTKIIHLAKIDESLQFSLNNAFIQVKNDHILGTVSFVRKTLRSVDMELILYWLDFSKMASSQG